MACCVTRRLLICKRIANVYEYANVASYSCMTRCLLQGVPQKPYYEGQRNQFIFPVTSVYYKHFSTTKKLNNDTNAEKKNPLTLFQKFKQMYRDYWYVLVPVHIVTSAAWFGSFYYMAKR